MWYIGFNVYGSEFVPSKAGRLVWSSRGAATTHSQRSLHGAQLVPDRGSRNPFASAGPSHPSGSTKYTVWVVPEAHQLRLPAGAQNVLAIPQSLADRVVELWYRVYDPVAGSIDPATASVRHPPRIAAFDFSKPMAGGQLAPTDVPSLGVFPVTTDAWSAPALGWASGLQGTQKPPAGTVP